MSFETVDEMLELVTSNPDLSGKATYRSGRITSGLAVIRPPNNPVVYRFLFAWDRTCCKSASDE
jgi:hypothetical protein